MKLFALTSASAFLALLAGGYAWQGAQAQPSENPNMGHFYMARRQITITDEAPAVNDQRTNPQAGAGAGPGMAPGLGRALPKAGWTPYSQFVPGLSTNLPKTANGVPVPVTAGSPDPNGLRGKAGKLKSSKPASAKPRTTAGGPPSTKTYTPYKGYGAPQQMVKGGGNNVPNYTAGGSSGGGNSGPSYSYGSSQTETNVRGSVLHWARVKRQKLN